MVFAGGEVEEEGPKTIGFSVYDMQYGFFQQMEIGTREKIDALGYDYILHDEKSDETLMVSGCQDLINQGIDALIISPHKPEALGPIVEAAHEKGIPVIVNDIGGGGADYDVMVVSDCYGGGELAGDYVVEILGEGNGSEVAIIKCEPSAVFAIRRGEGFKAVVEAAGYVVVSELSGHSKPEEGYQIMQDIITSNPDVKAVFAENDPMAAAAAQACVDAGRTDIMVIGFNGDEIALEAIEAGTMVATIQQVPALMGELTAELADKLINGETLEFDDDATREIYAPVFLITADNIEESKARLR
jgi:ribose transport system substrate-binding protein